jgi:ribonuclease D
VNDQNNDIKKNLLSFPGKIHLICSNEELLAIADDLNTAKILGFDTETRPSFKKGQVYKVALLQLSTQDDAYIIRLHTISEFQVLVDVLENTKIIKVGAAILEDLRTLQKAFKFTPGNFIELQSLAKIKGLKNFGLKGMSEEVLHGTISKKAKMTNWEMKDLNDKQLMYAATDAWIGLKIFETLRNYEDIKK